MSWLDDISDSLGSAWNWLTNTNAGNTVLTLGTSAIAGYVINTVNSSAKKPTVIPPAANGNKKPPTGGGGSTALPPSDPATASIPDPGVRLQLSPSTENKIPVVYGNAVLSGKVTDAQLSIDRTTMAVCLAICEKTGKLNLGQGADSVISFGDIYWNDNKLLFGPDGVTVSGFIDNGNVVNTDVAGLIKVWLFSGSSLNPVLPTGSTAPNPGIPAYQLMPNWDSNWMMPDLVFAVVGVTFNRPKGVTSVGTFKFKLSNTLTEPGDCLYDYMTNPNYGAGIDPAEIYSQ